MSKFLDKQRRLHEHPFNTVRKDFNKRCIILAVYDSDFTDPPDEVKKLQEQYPGYLFAQIQVPGAVVNNGLYYVPFAHPVDELFATYGNGLAITGRSAVLKVHNNNYKSGLLYLIRDQDKRIINHSETKEIFDIGRI